MPLRYPTAGDIVVTKVGAHYHVGRVQSEEGKPLATISPAVATRTHALALACRLVTGSQGVFLDALGSQRQCVEIDCTHAPWPREL